MAFFPFLCLFSVTFLMFSFSCSLLFFFLFFWGVPFFSLYATDARAEANGCLKQNRRVCTQVPEDALTSKANLQQLGVRDAHKSLQGSATPCTRSIIGDNWYIHKWWSGAAYRKINGRTRRALGKVRKDVDTRSHPNTFRNNIHSFSKHRGGIDSGLSVSSIASSW